MNSIYALESAVYLKTKVVISITDSTCELLSSLVICSLIENNRRNIGSKDTMYAIKLDNKVLYILRP